MLEHSSVLEHSCVSTGCVFLAEVGFLGRWPAFALFGGIVALMCACPDGLVYSTGSFLSVAVCGVWTRVSAVGECAGERELFRKIDTVWDNA